MKSDEWSIDDHPDRKPLVPGTRIGVYRIESKLGQGGMGVVYQALDTKLNRPVAIKFLSDELATAAARRRFQREAQMASALNHPHILTVHDAAEFENRQYIVTEFVDGGTLKDWIRADKRTWRQVVELLTGVADGLAAAHLSGILHRDIKPQTILVAKNGYAKLADFGLAKLEQPSPPKEATETLTEANTRPGAIVGTVAYMSPEQASGGTFDARSDVFSFGIVLYEALAGRRPFEGASELDVLQAIVRSPAPALSPEVPAALRGLIEKTLEKDPAERYQTMRDLVVDLRRLSRQTAETPAETAVSPPSRTLLSRPWIIPAAVVALLAGGLAVWKWRPSPSATAQIHSIAVLPLENFSGDPNQEYLSDGTTEALIANLAQIRSLKVISRTSVMRFKGTTKAIPDIGRELGVDAIIEGSVHRVGDRVRITAQLIHASTDAHMWAQNYERNMSGMLDLEAEVARAIAQEIRAEITAEESGSMAGGRPVDPAAQEAYLLGTYSRWKLKTADLKQAIQYFERAIQIQPDFASAYAGLSGAWAEIGSRDSVAPGRAAALKALELDPKLSEAHSALARMSMSYDWDWASAEQGFKRALELNPNSLEYCQCYADLLAGMSRFPEAIAILERGVTLNPLSSAIQAAMGRVLVWQKNYNSAIPHLQKALELDPQNAVADLFLGEAYEVKGDFPKALAATEQYLRLRGVDSDNSPLVGRIYAKQGRRADALRVLSNLTKPGANPNARDLSTLYFALGDKDRGFEALTKAFDEKQDVLRVRVSGLFDGVRDDPRMQALVARLQIPEAR